MRTEKGYIARRSLRNSGSAAKVRMNRVAKAIKETEAAAKFIATRYSRA
jgi:hypothetical protein